MTGEELLILRRRRRLTQAELGSMVGLTRVQISRLENGHNSIPPERERQFRRVLVEEQQLSFEDLTNPKGPIP